MIALSPDRHMARLQHYTSGQPQYACLINGRYGDVRTACTRSEKQRCASAKAITAHHRQAGRELFLGRLERECIVHTECPRQGLTERCHTRSNESISRAGRHARQRFVAGNEAGRQASGGPLALTLSTLLLVAAALSAQRRSRRACSLASHTAHALAPHSCLPFPKRSAGWLRAG